jgi:hypothetical protein
MELNVHYHIYNGLSLVSILSKYLITFLLHPFVYCFHINAYVFKIYLSLTLQSFVGPWPFFSFLILYTVGRTP